jgi:hypothetical protein
MAKYLTDAEVKPIITQRGCQAGETAMMTKTTDLTGGWFASLDRKADGTEGMTIRNPDKGQRINLGDASVKLLRAALSTPAQEA